MFLQKTKVTKKRPDAKPLFCAAAHRPFGRGTPVSGGLTFNQAVWLLDTLTRSGRRIIGFDVVEVCPAPDERIDAITGARMLWKLCGQTLKSNES